MLGFGAQSCDSTLSRSFVVCLCCKCFLKEFLKNFQKNLKLDLHPTIDILCSVGRDAVCRVWDMRTKANIMTLAGLNQNFEKNRKN